MLLQVMLGITYYSKEMRIGTFVFVLCVFQLAYMGPSPRTESNIFHMFLQPLAIGWLATLGGLTMASTLGIMATMSATPENFPKILFWSLLISCLGSLTDNGASTFGLLDSWTFFVAVGFYGLV